MVTGRVVEPRVRALFRVLGIPLRLPALPGSVARLAGAVAGSHRRPLPARLGRRLEHLVERRHRAGRRRLRGGDAFILPRWLVAAREPSADVGVGALRLHVDALRAPGVTVNVDATGQELTSVTLSPRNPARWRRDRIVDTAASIGRDLVRVLGRAPACSAWLTEMASTPEIAEQAAIAVWKEFLDVVDVPLGLRIPDFESTLADLLLVVEGPRGGRDRQWFANQWPAAAAIILRAGQAEQELRRIDNNRAAAIAVATAAFCCREMGDCEHARRLAREIPKYRTDSCLSRVLAGHGPRMEVHIRALLAKANQKENGALLRRMARCSAYAREQMELAAATAVQPVFVSGGCRMAMGQLLARTFAGSGFDPAGLDPANIAAVFITVSADCLAAFVTERVDIVGTDKLEVGVLAFATTLAVKRWRLSPGQFAGFIAGAERHVSILEQRSKRSRKHDTWPGLAAWHSADTFCGGAAIAPLLSRATVRAEGEAMKNCLARDNTFERRARLGQLALFSIQAEAARATLAIKPLERRGKVESYTVAQLKGPQNAPPHPSCQAVAQALVARLNSRLPRPPSTDASSRRQHQFGNQRRFNANRDLATERWRGYVEHLPKRFRATSPAQMVKGYEEGTM